MLITTQCRGGHINVVSKIICAATQLAQGTTDASWCLTVSRSRHRESGIAGAAGGSSPHYGNDYRLLSRVGWSGLAGAQILLGLILTLLASATVVIGIDET
jgi:hypothetical protein